MGRFMKTWMRYICAVLFAGVLASCETTEQTPSGPSYLNTHSLSEIVVNYDQAAEPIYVAEIEGNFRKSKLASEGLSVGQRFTGQYRSEKRQAQLASINNHLNRTYMINFYPNFAATDLLVLRS